CAGELVGTLAIEEPRVHRNMSALRTAAEVTVDGRWRLNGTKHHVPHADAADIVGVFCRPDSDAGGNVPPRIVLVDGSDFRNASTIRQLHTFGYDRQHDAEIRDLAVPAPAVLGRREEDGASDLLRVRDRLVALLCAEMIGGAERVVELVAD